MASSSSSLSTSRRSYDVFLSFRGTDTRKGFTDHLYTALVRDGIHTFRDNNKIKIGEEIGSECLKAIEESRFSIVILSEGYASSTWCLDELVHIMKCRETLGHVVWPVFYDVDPTHVEKLERSFGKAFAAHEERFLQIQDPCLLKEEMHKVEAWKAALREVAYLKGLDLQKHLDGQEAKNIEYIVKEISDRLDRENLYVATHPVGLQSRAKQVISLLADESLDVRIVGIYGMGGIGKTTLAKEVYNSVFHKFKGSCYLENVREQSDSKGMAYLQRQLLSQILKRKYEKIDNVGRGLNIIRERLCHINVLIVLDDVDKLDRLNEILGDCGWLSSGTRVIITTRTENLLPPSNLYRQYDVPKLDGSDALQLFSLHAFNNRDPMKDYLDCARQVVSYAGGIPLALEVLGSSLHGQSIEVWQSRLEKLKAIGSEDIHRKLKISYDSLDDTEKSCFLDIVCFFIGVDKDYVVSILDDCDFFPVDGINTLMRRCLIKVDSGNKFMVHELIRDMGREIIRKESVKDPGERSRIWNHKDVIDVLTSKMGTKAVEGLILNQPGLTPCFSSKAFKKMKRLRLLQINHVRVTGSYEYISSKIRWLCWHEFAMESIPSDLCLENVIALDMRYSRIKNVFEEEQALKKLKFLNLSHSHELTETPNFKGFCNLEKLKLKDCISLVKVDDSIGFLSHLKLLNLQDCKSLKNLPRSICALRSLQKLNLSGCSKLEEFPEDLGHLKSLNVLVADQTAVSTLPETISSLEKLERLSLRGCHLIFTPTKCPFTINFLPSSLRILDLRYCNISDDVILHDFQGLPLLQDLKLCGNNFTSLPASLGSLDKLRTLWLNSCRRLRYIPQLHSSVQSLQADDCPLLECINLTNTDGASALQLTGCRNLKEVVGFYNLEPLRVEIIEKILKAIDGLFVQESTANMEVQVLMIDSLTDTCQISTLQALSMRGIYNIFLPGSEIPIWFGYQSEGDTISFHVPPLDKGANKIVGIATCTIYSWAKSYGSCFFMPHIMVSNKTKNFEWMHTPYITFLPTNVEQDMIWICYWMFDDLKEGIDEVDMSWRFKDEMDEGNEVEFSVDMGFGIAVKRCGVHLLHRLDAAISMVSCAASRHHRRFSHSFPRWLTMKGNQKLSLEARLFPSNSDDTLEFDWWSKKRTQRVDQIHPYLKDYKQKTLSS